MLRKHIVRTGDTLWNIATRYGIKSEYPFGTPLDELLTYNKLLNQETPLQPGTEVILPLPFHRHLAQKGDTLFRIARQYGVPVQVLYDWAYEYGEEFPEDLIAGETIIKIPRFRYKYYTAKPGDTAVSIANNFALTPAEFLAINPSVMPDLIYAGYRYFLPDQPFFVTNPIPQRAASPTQPPSNQQTIPASDSTVYICFLSDITDASTNRLMDVVSRKQKEGVRRFVILLHSPGGSIVSAITAYNFLTSFRDIEIVMHNIGMVASAAVTLFCAGHQRLSTPYSYFHIHEVMFDYQSSSGPEGQTTPVSFKERDLIERYKTLEQGRTDSARILSVATKREIQQVIKEMKETVTLDSVYAITYGLVHRVTDETIKLGQKVIVILPDSIIEENGQQEQGGETK